MAEVSFKATSDEITTKNKYAGERNTYRKKDEINCSKCFV